MARYSNPVSDAGHGAFTGHFEKSDGPKAPANKFTQGHGMPDNFRHLLPGDHTHVEAIKAVRAQAMQTYPAPAKKPGTQATLQLGAPTRNVKALANMDDRTISQGEAIKRTVKVMGKNDCY
jgi:hypothetical protein